MNAQQLEGYPLGELFSSSGTEKEAGSGLGIILIKEFLLQMKGDLIVESTPDVGTTVTIRMPGHLFQSDAGGSKNKKSVTV